ncbi:MAG: hypothetical protein WCK27_28305 [Verrucomicrobiota bacterium]|jgi:hypothetical protein
MSSPAAILAATKLGQSHDHFTPADMARVEGAIPASATTGNRYDEHQMRMLDSESKRIEDR